MHSENIENLDTTTFFGRRFTRKQISEIKQTVEMYPNLSRRELGNTICENFSWYTPNGKYKIQTCLRTLEKLEKLGIITLPALKKSIKASPKEKAAWSVGTEYQTAITSSLKELLPLRLEVVTEKHERQLWDEFVDRYHYLGFNKAPGSNLRYYIFDAQNRKLGCILFSHTIKKLECRDQWIGWDEKIREKNLAYVINNGRFLIFPWIQVKYLASKILSMSLKTVGRDWEKHNGYRPLLLETFVDPSRYEGTCYKASNWEHIGYSTGKISKKGVVTNNRKKVFIYSLVNNPKKELLRKDKKLMQRKSKMNESSNHKPKIIIDDPFIKVWQKILGVISKVSDEYDSQWQKRRRVINTLLLILMIFRLVFAKAKQGYGITVVELWEQCQTIGIQLPQTKPVTQSAFCNARKKLDEDVFKTLNTRILNAYSEINKVLWKGYRLFAVDGTRINLPRELMKDNYRTPSDNANYPQGLASCLYQLDEKIPVDFELASHMNERKCALQHLRYLSENDIVVYDRGYFSYFMLHTHLRKNIPVVFRLTTSRSYKVFEDFAQSDDVERIVSITASYNTQQKIKKRNEIIEFIPLKLRLIKYKKSDTTYVLGTTLMDQEKFSIEELADLYFKRWGIEELYKISKILIDVEDFHSKNERGVKQELFAHFVLITISRLFSNYIESELQTRDNIDDAEKTKVNFKNCLATIARNMEELILTQVKLIGRSLKKIITNISTCVQKERKNRSYKRASMKPRKKWSPISKKKIAHVEITNV